MPLKDPFPQMYDASRKELKQSFLKKPLDLVEHNCIVSAKGTMAGGEYAYLCLPLNKAKTVLVAGKHLRKKPLHVNYNKTTYHLMQVDGIWTCDCQGYISKKRRGIEFPTCSHTYALKLYFERSVDMKVLRFLKSKKSFCKVDKIIVGVAEKEYKVRGALYRLRETKQLILYHNKYWGVK